MKRLSFLLLLILGITTSFAQDDDKNDLPEYTGENFSLEGALALFKQANSLEEFEKSINEENNNVNNLDLNNDGEIDYIVVQDIQEKDIQNKHDKKIFLILMKLIWTGEVILDS